MDSFDRFWAEYPKKRAKGDARKAWHKLQPDATLVEAILTALAWQRVSADWIKDGGQFIPYPATWLNQERWDDEPYENPKRSPAAIASLKEFREEMQRKRESA